MVQSFLDSDITADAGSLDFAGNSQAAIGHTNSVPTAIFDRKAQTLVPPLLVQIILVIDISKSKHSLLDAIKGDIYFPGQRQVEETGGPSNTRSTRRIIRPTTLDGGGGDEYEGNTQQAAEARQQSTNPESTAFKISPKSMHKVIFQDAKGTLFYGIELQKLSFLSMKTPLGSKV